MHGSSRGCPPPHAVPLCIAGKSTTRWRVRCPAAAAPQDFEQPCHEVHAPISQLTAHGANPHVTVWCWDGHVAPPKRVTPFKTVRQRLLVALPPHEWVHVPHSDHLDMVQLSGQACVLYSFVSVCAPHDLPPYRAW